MTDVIVQLNFNTGAGDLYCALTQLINFSKKCYQRGLTVGFFYNFHSNQYFFDTPEINIHHFFNIEKKYYKFIEKKEATSNFEGFSHGFTPYLYSQSQKGGLHWWDMFISNEKISEKEKILENVITCCMREWQTEDKISEFPLFSESVMKRTIQPYDNMVGLHVRNLDYSETMDLVNNNLQKIEELTNNGSVYLFSNSKTVRDFFNNKKNILMASPRHENISYHYGMFKNNSNGNNTALIENFEDTLSEMHNASLCRSIYTLTEWNRPTNFLFYSRAFNKNIDIKTL